MRPRACVGGQWYLTILHDCKGLVSRCECLTLTIDVQLQLQVMKGHSVKDNIVELLAVSGITKDEGVCEAVLQYYCPLYWWNSKCVTYKSLSTKFVQKWSLSHCFQKLSDIHWYQSLFSINSHFGKEQSADIWKWSWNLTKVFSFVASYSFSNKPFNLLNPSSFFTYHKI